ncbi:MAG: histidine kinase [Pseudomonadales bacterium]|nr:histidine kinase [Pseudomonadales bacterium]
MMAAKNPSQKNRLALLQSAGSCATILAASYHVINQRVLYGGFADQEKLLGNGWTAHVIIITLLSAIYFITAVSVLIVEFNRADDNQYRRLLNNILNFQGFLVFSLFIFSPESAGIFAAMCLSRVRNFYSLKTALYIFLFTIFAFTASIAFYYGGELGVLGIVIVAVLAAGFYSFTLVHSHNAAREKELRQETVELNRELLATRELLAQSTRHSERLRISRNIHDLLGHQLTGLILKLEVASHITTGKGKKKVEQSLALAKLLLNDLRQAVSDLRESAFLDFNQSMNKVIASIPELNIDLSIEEGLVIGNAETVETLVRCIQEALTNILRHANATQCSISLFRQKGEIVLQINDNGSVKCAISPGNGLNGMLERITALSGKLHWDNRQGSFFLEAMLPLKVI